MIIFPWILQPIAMLMALDGLKQLRQVERPDAAGLRMEALAVLFCSGVVGGVVWALLIKFVML